ncbi:MAG TPA: type II toxin-antitoxin system prevent-host-death family antitoxin [Stellaceae bacterium]|nr:type II toxin-antitoxin system prevent-host-death family antitoxin [Stellaceae bacterium]
MQVNILEAKNRLSQLIKSVQAGEEVVIANRGVPVVRLVLAENTAAAKEPPIGSAERILGWLAKHPLPEYNRRSVSEIDADIERERDSWE